MFVVVQKNFSLQVLKSTHSTYKLQFLKPDSFIWENFFFEIQIETVFQYDCFGSQSLKCNLRFVKWLCLPSFRAGWMRYQAMTQRHTMPHWHTLCLSGWKAPSFVCLNPTTTSLVVPHTMNQNLMSPTSVRRSMTSPIAKYVVSMIRKCSVCCKLNCWKLFPWSYCNLVKGQL